jgi:hypothetical protein
MRRYVRKEGKGRIAVRLVLLRIEKLARHSPRDDWDGA